MGIDQRLRDFGFGLSGKFRALLFQLGPQLAEILDDAVADYGYVIGRMRRRVILGRPAVGGPAGMSDAGMAGERFGLQLRFKVFEFAFGAAAFEVVAFQRGDTGGIVAAILKPLERVHQLFRDGTAPENADNAAHADQSLQIGPKTVKTSYVS